MASPRQWFDRSQPQTLQGAVMLLYINAVLGLLSAFSLGGGGLLLLITVAEAVAGNAIANDKRLGYYGGIVLSFLGALSALYVLYAIGFSLSVFINVGFAILLVVLLLHRDSRSYQKIWFK